MEREAAAWVSALGLVPGARGGYVRTCVAGLPLESVLLTAAAPRFTVADDGAERLCFHHAGGAVRVGGGALLGPPRGYQVHVAAGRGRVVELSSGGWALISVAVGGAAEAVKLAPAGVRGGAGEGGRMIDELGLRPHVEGGYFAERWRAGDSVETPRGRRALGSTIYYLLTEDSPVGWFHRNASAISHFHHAGGPIVYCTIDPAGTWREVVLGRDAAAGQVPVFTCPGGWWKSSRLVGAEHGLISEIVAPGFHWDDQQMADEALFDRLYPRLRARWAGCVGPASRP